jgi:hypothetical protein
MSELLSQYAELISVSYLDIEDRDRQRISLVFNLDYQSKIWLTLQILSLHLLLLDDGSRDGDTTISGDSTISLLLNDGFETDLDWRNRANDRREGVGAGDCGGI